MADPSAKSTIVAMLQEDDAEGLGYTAATIAVKLWGPPRNPIHARAQQERVEVIIESLLRHGRLQIAGYLYLQAASIPRYKLSGFRPPGGE